MGKLHYGSGELTLDVPDFLLAHIKVVIATKLRRSEAFTLSWALEETREAVWLQEAIPLRFVFENPDPETLDPELLNTLSREAAGGNLRIDLRAGARAYGSGAMAAHTP